MNKCKLLETRYLVHTYYGAKSTVMFKLDRDLQRRLHAGAIMTMSLKTLAVPCWVLLHASPSLYLLGISPFTNQLETAPRSSCHIDNLPLFVLQASSTGFSRKTMHIVFIKKKSGGPLVPDLVRAPNNELLSHGNAPKLPHHGSKLPMPSAPCPPAHQRALHNDKPVRVCNSRT